jgi:hypothetical protein
LRPGTIHVIYTRPIHTHHEPPIHNVLKYLYF